MQTKIGTTRERLAYKTALERVNEAQTFETFSRALVTLMGTPRYAVYAADDKGRTSWRRLRDSRRTIIDIEGEHIPAFLNNKGRNFTKLIWKDINPTAEVKVALLNEFAKCAYDGSILQLDGTEPLFMLEAGRNYKSYCRFILGEEQ